MNSSSLKNNELKMRLQNRNVFSKKRIKMPRRPNYKPSKMHWRLKRRQRKPVLRKKSLRKNEKLWRNK
tara:strand:+ start:862 stop:1065 length:204 start_codon:yes stop_codon:yes gene_type:complete